MTKRKRSADKGVGSIGLVSRHRKSLIHALATCEVCGKEWGGLSDRSKEGRGARKEDRT